MLLKALSVVCVLGFWSGCAHGPSADPLIMTEGMSMTKLQLISGDNFHEIVFSPGLAGLEKDKEDHIRQQCNGPERRPEFAFIPLTFLIGPAIDFALDRIDKALEEELQKYIAAYSGSVSEKFYKSTNSDGPTASWTCFRFSRAVGLKNQEKVVLDLIGQISLTNEKDALKVRPLRLYFAQAKAKGEQIGITLSLKAESVWRQHNKGQSETTFEDTFLSQKIDISHGRPVVVYYLDKEWTSYPRLPLIPWSTNQEGQMKAGEVTFTVTAAEVGAPPKLLEHAVKLFTKNKGELATMMKDSAKKIIPEN